MSQFEREEMQAELNARDDYQWEAYGVEARQLERQAADEELENAGYFSEQGRAEHWRELDSRRRARAVIDHLPKDEIPF